MNLIKFLKPRPTISDQELATGLRWLTLEGTFSLGFNSITTSGFLAAFALALGARGSVRSTTLKAFTQDEFAAIVKKLP